MQDEKTINENRKHKDSLFVDYFSKGQGLEAALPLPLQRPPRHKFAGVRHTA